MGAPCVLGNCVSASSLGGWGSHPTGGAGREGPRVFAQPREMVKTPNSDVEGWFPENTVPFEQEGREGRT